MEGAYESSNVDTRMGLHRLPSPWAGPVGWIEMGGMVIMIYKSRDILAAIKRLGEVSLCGFSDVTEDDLPMVIQLLEPLENAEIEREIIRFRASAEAERHG